MKLKTEYKLLLGGSILSLLIIYLTKIDTTPASAQWIYNIGQYLWFNLAISYLGSMIFYLIVVFIPARRKRKIFLFQMGMDISNLHSKCLGLFFNLKNAAGMQDEITDTGKITYENVIKMIGIVDLETMHTFSNEPGSPKQTFRVYLENFKAEINDTINRALAIPYDDSELSLILLQLQRNTIVTGHWIEKDEKKIGQLDIGAFYIQLKLLDCYFKKHFAPIIFNTKFDKNKIK